MENNDIASASALKTTPFIHKFILITIFGTLITIVALLISALTSEPNIYITQDFLFDTFVTQEIYGQSGDIFSSELTAIHNQLSMYDESSDIWNINYLAGKSPVPVKRTTLDLLDLCKKYYVISKNDFNIAIAPVKNLWESSAADNRLPEYTELAQALGSIDLDKLELDVENNTAYLTDSTVQIDLGGIAKGYACEMIYDYYMREKISCAILSMGSSILLYGTKPDGKDFTVAVRNPDDESNYIGILTLAESYISTSGGYERYFEIDDKKYHHIIDPKTGYPAESEFISVTVVSDSGTFSDYLSTTLFIGGKSMLKSYINSEEIGIIAVDINYNVYVSEKLKNNFNITNENFTIKDL